jgi:hypothetical protein
VGFLRSRLSYANVVSTLALFLALSGGAVYAAGKIGSDDIAANAIKSKQIAPGAVQRSDMAYSGQLRRQGARRRRGVHRRRHATIRCAGKTKWTQGARRSTSSSSR